MSVLNCKTIIINKLLFSIAFFFFQTVYNMDAQINKDQTDREINSEYRKTRDAMNTTGKFKSIFKIQEEAATKPVTTSLKEGLNMRYGKMVSIKDDTVTPMNFDITLSNGTRVSALGVCEFKNGSKINLQDGDYIDFNGVYVSANN